MFPKAKRFQNSVPQAPPVGSYNVKFQDGKSGTASFGKGKRFIELKDTQPISADISLLDISSCSTSSRNGNKQFATPFPLQKPRNVKCSTPNVKDDTAKRSALEREIAQLLDERTELEIKLAAAQNEIQTLENRLEEHANKSGKIESLEGELKMVTARLQEKDGVISSLKLSLGCEVDNLKADLHLEQERNKALNERISSLEMTNSVVAKDRDDLEEANQKLHDLVAQLQQENLQLREKLDKAHQEIEVVHAKIEITTKESQNKIARLEEMLSNEILKSQEFGDKLECSLRQSNMNFYEAQSRVTQLGEANEDLKRKYGDLENKLFEVVEREQRKEEKARHLAADKESLESRLRKCQSDYEQRLAIANDQVDSLQQELQSYEEMMTQNLKSITDKYQDLEESYTCLQSETTREKQLIVAELEATKVSLRESQQEFEKQQATCFHLKEHNEELQQAYEEVNHKLQANMEKAESTRKELAEYKREEQLAKEEVRCLKDELCSTREEAELNKASLEKSLEEAQNTIKDLHQKEEALSKQMELVVSNKRRQDSELETTKELLERNQLEVQQFEVKFKELEENHIRHIIQVEEKAMKMKEEFGRRLVETQKKLSQTEVNFARFKSEQESKMKHKEMDMERKVKSAEEEVNKLKFEISSGSADRLNELKAEVEIWKTKFEDLERKIEPFKDQLDEYEAERRALLSENNHAKDEVAKLGYQYAKLLGHQNKKQKIHHVVKLKEENNTLKAELAKLRDQAEKQKRRMKKVEERLDHFSGKRKFNPADAFSHSRKENLPLSVISNGNGAVNP